MPLILVGLTIGGALSVEAASLPEIRVSAHNSVPACATPDRLMAFLKRRNDHLDPRFRNIASFYKTHGETWGVRWDYAFFQMAIETNFLTYRRPNGRMGDVDPRQNNFAGIGTTGGGVPGDSFPDVSTGVLGQIQHLVVYSGEEIARPVAPRTQLKQQHILDKSRELQRPVRFSDLARRWAADPKYASSIEWIATRFRVEACQGRSGSQAQAEPSPVKTAAVSSVKAVAASAAPIPVPIKKSRPPARDTVAVLPKPVSSPAVASEAQAAAQPQSSNDARSAPPAFALFHPPAALADVKMPEARPQTVEAVEAAPPMPQPAKPRQTVAVVAGPPPAPATSVMDAPASDPAGPPQEDPPKAVSGRTVAGFMVGGAAQKAEFAPPSGLGVKPGRCLVETARYGGETTVLVKTPEGDEMHYVALSVLDGFEESMTKAFLSSRAQGGEVVGTFASRDEALAKARDLCPD